MHDKYEVSLSYGSKVISNVKAFQDTDSHAKNYMIVHEDAAEFNSEVIKIKVHLIK